MPGGVDSLVHERDEQAMRTRLTPSLSTYERYAKGAKDRIGGTLGSVDPMRRDLLRKDLDKAGFTGISVEEYITFYNVAAIVAFLAGIVLVGIGVFLAIPTTDQMDIMREYGLDLIPTMLGPSLEWVGVLITDMAVAMPIAVFISLFTLNSVKGYPKSVQKQRMEETERELPDFLRALALEQCMHVKIEESLMNVSQGDYGPISKTVGIVVRQSRAGGMSLADALKNVGDQQDSQGMGTAFKQLAIAVESGANIESPLWNLSKNADDTLINKLREYSGKLKGLVAFYITTSTVFPAMLGALMVVAVSSGMADMPTFMFYVIFGGIFPLINAAIIWYMISSEPVI